MPFAGSQSWIRHCSPLLSLAFLACLLLLGVYRFMASAPVQVSVGPADRRFILDTHASEQFGGISGRWTNGDSQLLLPPPAAHTALILSLTLLNSRPTGFPDPILDLRLQDAQLARFALPRSTSGPRAYHLLLPPQDPAGWQLRFGLRSDTVRPAADPRDLGLVLIGARLRATATPLLPPTLQLLAWLGLSLGTYLALRGLGTPPSWAWGMSVLGLLLLAFGQASQPLQFAPYTLRLAALAGLGVVYGLGARQGTGYRVESSDQLQGAADGSAGTAADARGECTVSCNLLTITSLMGLAYWLMPLFQLVMSADGVPGVLPSPATLWIGAAGLVLALAGWLLLLRAPLERRLGWLTTVLALAAVVHLVTMIQFAFTRSGPDFWIIYKTVRDWAQKDYPLYNLAGIAENHFGHTFKVPPFYGMLMLPFVGVAGEQVLLGHRILNTVLLAATLLAWFRFYRVALFSALGAGILLVYNMRPAADVIAFGQIDIVLLALLVLALLASQQGSDWLAGAALAVGTLFKLYPAVMLGFFIAKGQWRAVLGFVTTMVLCNGLAIAVMGWAAHQTYLFEVLPLIGGGTAWVENQTLNGFLSRLAGGEMASNKFDQPLVTLATYAGFVAAAGLAFVLALPPSHRRSTQYLLQYAQFVLLMVLFIPTAWMHYATITIVTFVAVLFAAAERPLPYWRAALFGLAYALVCYGNQWSFFGGTVMGPLTLAGLSYKFYGLVLLASVLVACLLDYPIAVGIRRSMAQLRRYGTSRI